jgi:NAD-dependent DNA ligase
METHALNRCVEHLLGIVSGVVADGELTEGEVLFLRTWLTEHEPATREWPGSAIQRAVQEIVADGIVTAAERAHLLDVLRTFAASDFSLTGSASPEVSALPINDTVTIVLRDAGVCHTGEFLFGTRAACERATLRAGGMPTDNVSRKVDVLVVGTRVAPAWSHTSFGRKIKRAVELQDGGHPIEIISERRWLQALQP